MNSNFESCRAKLEELRAWYEPRAADRNEATTRLQLIDRFFFECLGWDREDAVLEESHAGEYADYTFTAPRRLLIVEAKREGAYFELAAGETRPEHSLKALARDYPSLPAAIDQAAGYCQARGV